MGQTHSYAPKTTSSAPPATTTNAPTTTTAGSNATQVSQMGLPGDPGICEELPVAGEYGGQCHVPIILKNGAAEGDQVAGLATLSALGTKWGLSVPSDAVRLARASSASGAALVVEIVWPAAWGAAPLQAGIGAVEAHFAALGLSSQAGWAKVSADDQTRLQALLGGESNALSAAARAALSALLSGAGWAAKSADEQATALVGLLSSKDAQPDVVNESVAHLEAAKYKMTGPATEKNHVFTGSTEDADVYTITFDGTGKVIKIYMPHKPNKTLSFHTATQAAEAAARLPEGSRKVVNSIIINPVANPDDAYWAREYKDPTFSSYMTAGASGDVTIYPSSGKLPSDNYMRGTMIHETGHTWSQKKWGADETKGGWVKWKEAMAKDKASVSAYATAAIAEDVAETIQVYAGSKGSPAFDEYRKIVPARFTILDAQL